MRIVAPLGGLYRRRVFQDLSFHVVGVSHHTASVGLREQFAFTPAELAALLEGERAAGRFALLLFTCNRCELYWSGMYDYESWFRELARARGVELLGRAVAARWGGGRAPSVHGQRRPGLADSG